MEAIEASVGVVECFIKASTCFHKERNSFTRPDPDGVDTTRER